MSLQSDFHDELGEFHGWQHGHPTRSRQKTHAAQRTTSRSVVTTCHNFTLESTGRKADLDHIKMDTYNREIKKKKHVSTDPVFTFRKIFRLCQDMLQEMLQVRSETPDSMHFFSDCNCFSMPLRLSGTSGRSSTGRSGSSAASKICQIVQIAYGLYTTRHSNCLHIQHHYQWQPVPHDKFLTLGLSH